MPKYTITIRENDTVLNLSLTEFYQIMKLHVPEVRATTESIAEIKGALAKKCQCQKKPKENKE